MTNHHQATQAKQRLQHLRQNLEAYSAHLLKIADKQGITTPFLWNHAQRHVHQQLEQQLAETGKVRALILKGRQQGISTYTAARFYHRCTMHHGKRALIVGHEQKSTDSLFGMVKRFHKHNRLGISTSNTNAKELIFDKLDGGYKLATAGSDDVGRGNTAQVAHLSEFAFWRNAQTHMAGLGNTIAELPGTEIIIESTANGLGNYFHTLWQDAQAGLSPWLPIFAPWYWQDEYRATVREDLQDKLTSADREYQAAYQLDLEQMQWRADKIATYGAGFEWLFQQEYPANPAEAFVSSTSNPLIAPLLVQAAIDSSYREPPSTPLIIGCDPAGDGAQDADRTAIAFRQGRMCRRIEYHQSLDTMQIAGKLAQYNQEHQPAAIFIDKGGLGAGVFDRLKELGAPAIGINSAQKANDTELFENKRAEMWWLMRDWFADQPCRIPDNAALLSDLTAPQPKTSSNGRRLLEKKDDMQRRGIRSPDGADALALTFAEPVATPATAQAWMLHHHAPLRPGTAGY